VTTGVTVKTGHLAGHKHKLGLLLTLVLHLPSASVTSVLLSDLTDASSLGATLSRPGEIHSSESITFIFLLDDPDDLA
jgi:hypothetical protein